MVKFDGDKIKGSRLKSTNNFFKLLFVKMLKYGNSPMYDIKDIDIVNKLIITIHLSLYQQRELTSIIEITPDFSLVIYQQPNKNHSLLQQTSSYNNKAGA